MKRVRAGKEYVYQPVGLDLWESRTINVAPGEVVKVVSLPGCPPPNTMGHCHITKRGIFAGLVLTNSLEEIQ